MSLDIFCVESPDYARNETRKNIEYSTGTTRSVNALAKARPKIIVIAIGLNMAVPPQSNGVMPRTVVAVVNSMGRILCWQAVKIASC